MNSVASKPVRVFSVVAILSAVGLVVPYDSGPADAQAKALPPFIGVYAAAFGVSDEQMHFMSLLKSGEVVTDATTIAATTIGTGSDLNLGPGHGIWRFNSNGNKVIVKTVHADPVGTEMCWQITRTMTADVNGDLSGQAKIKEFASFKDTDPQSIFQALCTLERIKAAGW